MSSIAIITARGGSKRIPRKNIKDFCGKPVIAYSIEAALESSLFDEVMVSTDDGEIAEVAKKYGAAVPFMRSARTSDDYSTVADALNEVLRNYESLGISFDEMCCIYATAPFVTPKRIVEAHELVDFSSASMVCAVSEFSFPPMRGFVRRDGRMEYRFPECAPLRSQDLEPMYQDAGQFYFYSPRAIGGGQLQVEKIIGYEVPQTEVQDIDNLVDWQLAELKYKLMNGVL